MKAKDVGYAVGILCPVWKDISVRIPNLLRLMATTTSTQETRRYWLFYAGPENYLSRDGIRELPQEVFWSCEAETRQGDLILVYRRSMNQLSVGDLVRDFAMPEHVAAGLKKARVGKDFPLVWEATSNAQRKLFWGWPYGCHTREVQRINPPILLEELKAEPLLRRWEGLRWNLQARGRSALEIPEFAWKAILKVIEMRKSGG